MLPRGTGSAGEGGASELSEQVRLSERLSYLRGQSLVNEQHGVLLAQRPQDGPAEQEAIGELNAGAPPTQVAEWAEHRVNVLLRVYAR